nr:hypothetical protein [Geotalea toluenoxydans]
MSDHKTMTLTLNVWRQKGPNQPGKFETYTAKGITEHHSFLEMIDVVNEDLIKSGKEPIVFDHDCVRESVVCVLRLSTVCPMEPGEDHRLPAPHAEIQGWGHNLHRTMACNCIPDHQGPGR